MFKQSYRTCNQQVGLDNLASLLSLDLAFSADLLMRGGLAAFLEVPTLIEEMNNYLNSGDYFHGGKAVGKITKLMFDVNIAN